MKDSDLSPLEKFQRDSAIRRYTRSLVTDAIRTEPDRTAYGHSINRVSEYQTMRLLHAAMGLVTEAGEFLDQLKKHIFYGKPLDRVNLIEELGDSSWYERIAVDALEVEYRDMLQRNVDKLKARFPEKFNEANAKERDLVKERSALESETSIYPATIEHSPKERL